MAKKDTDKVPFASRSRVPMSIPCRKLVKQQKRGGESYDKLLRKMVAQYDPGEDTQPAVHECETDDDESPYGQKS